MKKLIKKLKNLKKYWNKLIKGKTIDIKELNFWMEKPRK